MKARLLAEAKGDVNHALDIAIERLMDAYRGCSSGMHYAPPVKAILAAKPQMEPLDVATETSPHG